MSRYRLIPTPEQERALREHRAHARFVWNLAVEQQSWRRRGRASAPGYLEQCRQLTAARGESDWLAAGSQTVQQQALRDVDQAMRWFFAGTHRRPGFRKASRHNGFRIVAVKPGHLRRLNRRAGEVWVPKVGWVRFRWSRAVPECRSYRVTLDRAGQWHVAFAAIPEPVPGPGTGAVVGVDRGVAVSAALSTGELLTAPRLGPGRQRRLVLLQRRLLVTRLEQKAPDRVQKVHPPYTSQRCSACGHADRDSRESQADFRCTSCRYAGHADVHAAINIAAGHAVPARRGDRVTGPAKREPQHHGLRVA